MQLPKQSQKTKLISNTKQVEVEPNTEGSSVLVLQWTVTDDSLQKCRGTNREVEPGEAAEFLKWKEHLPNVAETSIERR